MSSGGKNVSFIQPSSSGYNNNNSDILIYNIATGNKKIFEPFSLKLDDSINSIYMSTRNNIKVPIIYQVDYNTYQYKILKDLSQDETLEKECSHGDFYYIKSFEIFDISPLTSTGFYFTSSDGFSIQL